MRRFVLWPLLAAATLLLAGCLGRGKKADDSEALVQPPPIAPPFGGHSVSIRPTALSALPVIDAPLDNAPLGGNAAVGGNTPAAAQAAAIIAAPRQEIKTDTGHTVVPEKLDTGFGQRLDKNPKPPPGTGATEFKWTESPTVEGIPNRPVGGLVCSKPFEVKQVVIETGGPAWQINLLGQTLSDNRQQIPQIPLLKIDVKEKHLAPGVKLLRSKDVGDIDLEFPSLQDPKTLASWNGINAYAIEITKWDVKPYDSNVAGVQVAGTAAGRLAVICVGEEATFVNSWFAGTFDGALVRYTTKPE